VEFAAVTANLSQPDDELLGRARDGDAQALETLILRYQPRVYRYGMSMCGDHDAAGDVAQETLLAMARSVGDFRGDSSVGTWLFTIARRFCMRKRRRSKFAPATEHSLDALGPDGTAHLSDPAPDPESTAAGREISAALTAAIDALEPGQREVLVLRDVEGLSAPEVAQVLGISVDAVKSRLHRARVAVRERIAPLVGTVSPPSAKPASCPDVLSLFSRHLEGDIAPDICAQMEAHLERCGDCRGVCDSLKQTLASCRALATRDVPTPVAESVRAAVRAFLDARS
jgi:RNA polymerase sigma-70 factor, ECF subfamily